MEIVFNIMNFNTNYFILTSSGCIIDGKMVVSVNYA